VERIERRASRKTGKQVGYGTVTVKEDKKSVKDDIVKSADVVGGDRPI
jgi:hypothetical protein